MNTESTKSWDFWVLVGLMIGLMGFMFSINARINNMSMNMSMNMATKADIARVEADIARVEANLHTKADKIDIKEIRTLLIDHLKDGHNHHTRQKSRRPASHKPK